MATLQVPGQPAASNRPPRTSSLPRSPKSSRGRPRRVKPAPPPTLQQRVATIKRSPYFLPALVAFLAFFFLLVYSALRIVSRTDATVVLPTYAKPTTSRPSPPTSPKPRPVAAKDATPPEKPRLTSEDVKRVAEEALEQVWGLGSDKPEPGGEPVLEPPAKQVPLGKSAAELAAAKLRFEEMMKATEDMSADDLTQMLNDAYRREDRQ